MSVLEEIRALYAQVPKIDCLGKCHEACGPIEMTEPERQRIVDVGGPRIDRVQTGDLLAWSLRGEAHDCPALGMFKQCTVYADRPLICRLWGVAEGLRCPHGCKLERLLTDEEALGLLHRASEITGDADHAKLRLAMRELGRDPTLGRKLARYAAGDDSVKADIVRKIDQACARVDPRFQANAR